MATVPLVLALLLSGCVTPTEADRQLLHQTKEAGKLITERAVDPVVKQAGVDVTANSETLAKNLVGNPAQPRPYSPEESAKTRDDSDKSHESGWFGLLLTGALTLMGAGGLLPIAQRFLPMILGGRAAKAASLAVEGIAKVRAAAKASADGKLGLDDITKLIEEAQTDPRVQELLATLAKKAEEKLGLKGI